MRTNRETIDDSARQTLTLAEIETLKKEGTNAGQDIIAKLMASHLALDQKTKFSLAKYKLMKTKKYSKRFTVLPLDVRTLGDWYMSEKDASRIMEIREEMLALTMSWSNVHFSESIPMAPELGGGRWLVVDETGGLLVAALAERMGILHPEEEDLISNNDQDRHVDKPITTSNTLTVVHANAQPNLSILSYWHYSPTAATTSPNHPLSTNLHSISWLQLLSPEKDLTYASPPETLSSETLATLKSAKRGNYYRKLRRYTRCKNIVDSTRAGGFDGLVVASHMDPISIMRHTIPLLRGGATISIYSPTVEPLTALADVYSMSRRTAFIQAPPGSYTSLSSSEKPFWQGGEDFPLNPTMLLNVTVQTARVKEWQVLPGRTHPLMTGRGGAEGYLFTAVKVIPASGKVEARGKFVRKRVAEAVLEGSEGKSVKVEEGSAANGITMGGEADNGDSKDGIVNEEEDAIMQDAALVQASVNASLNTVISEVEG